MNYKTWCRGCEKQLKENKENYFCFECQDYYKCSECNKLVADNYYRIEKFKLCSDCWNKKNENYKTLAKTTVVWKSKYDVTEDYFSFTEKGLSLCATCQVWIEEGAYCSSKCKRKDVLGKTIIPASNSKNILPPLIIGGGFVFIVVIILGFLVFKKK